MYAIKTVNATRIRDAQQPSKNTRFLFVRNVIEQLVSQKTALQSTNAKLDAKNIQVYNVFCFAHFAQLKKQLSV